MAIDNKDKKVLKSSIEREQNEVACSAECEKIKGSKNLNVPPLRFPEFSGEWKCTTIGNIGDIKNGPFGSVLHAEDYVENGIPIVTTEHFKTGLMPSDKFGIPQVSNEDYIRLKGYRLETNDIVFSRVGSVDINAHVGIEQNGWLFSGRVLRVRPKYDIDSLFLHYALSTEAVKRDIRNRAVGQTMPSINTPILSSTTIQLPKDLFEQKKVAHFLRLLDERIITQNKIIEKLQSLIKGLAAQLTQSGTPNIRLCDCLECHSSTLQENCVSVTGSYPVYGATGLIGYTNNYAYNGESILIVKDGSGVGSLSYVNDHFSVIGTLNYLTAKENYSILYLYYALMAFNFTPYITGMAIPHIYFKDYGKAKLFYPSIEKRIRIASLLHNIEQKLVVEQNLVISLSAQKSYLLRMLFI